MGFLQQVCLNVSTSNFSLGSEVDTDEFTESGRVVVTGGLSVSVSLKYRVSLHDLVLKVTLSLALICAFLWWSGGDVGEVHDDFPSVLSFSGSRFSGNQHRLVLAILQHTLVGVVSHREQVRRHLSLPAALVVVDDLLCVDGQAAVGVHSYAEKTGVSINKSALVARGQVMQDRGLVQVGHVGHVFDLLVLWRVHLLDVIFLDCPGL